MFLERSHVLRTGFQQLTGLGHQVRERPDELGQHTIVAGFGQRIMELDRDPGYAVAPLNRAVDLSQHVLDTPEVFRRGALGGQRGDTGFNDNPGFDYFENRFLLQQDSHYIRVDNILRRECLDEAAQPRANFDEVEGGHHLKRLADACPADAKPLHEFALRGQLASGLEGSILQPADQLMQSLRRQRVTNWRGIATWITSAHGCFSQY